MKNYQRRHLRAPFKECILYSSDQYVLKARAINISEGGVLLDELPSFPTRDDVPIMFCIQEFPQLKNFNLLKLQTFNREIFPKHVIRAKVKMVRRVQLAQNLENIFQSRFGLEFIRMTPGDQKVIEEYVTSFSSNLIHLQTMMDSYNSDEENKIKVRTLAKILGYDGDEKVSQLRNLVTNDYKSLQWL